MSNIALNMGPIWEQYISKVKHILMVSFSDLHVSFEGLS